MTRTLTLTRLAKGCLPSVLVLGVLVVSACTTDYASFCEKKTACNAGNDKDRNACEAEASADQEIAAAYGCDELWLNYIVCAEKSACTERFFDTSKCAREEKALIDCKRVASGLKPTPTVTTTAPDASP
jgi:hypothetical protein